MIKRAIINSDDFGLTQGISIGTIHAHTDGILTSTTCMMNMPFAKFALNLAKDYPNLGVGIHLVFTVGRPLIPGKKSFTDEDGNFKKLNTYDYDETLYTIKSNANLDELYDEWKAQIENFIKLAGKKPTHIDSHHHAHLFPDHQQVTIRLATEYDIPIRQVTKIIDHYEFVRCDASFYGTDLTNDDLINILKNDDDIIDIMCHPAYLDQRMMDISNYHLPRMKEMEIIRSDEVKKFVKDNNIELINYSGLKKL